MLNTLLKSGCKQLTQGRARQLRSRLNYWPWECPPAPGRDAPVTFCRSVGTRCEHEPSPPPEVLIFLGRYPAVTGGGFCSLRTLPCLELLWRHGTSLVRLCPDLRYSLPGAALGQQARGSLFSFSAESLHNPFYRFIL